VNESSITLKDLMFNFPWEIVDVTKENLDFYRACQKDVALGFGVFPPVALIFLQGILE
jgi:hypothetical protein